MVRCASCGAAREEGAKTCTYCGSDFTLHEQDLETICPSCLARIGNTAHFCHHCGTAIAPEEVAADPTDRVCPSCGAGRFLHSRPLGDTTFTALECGVCAGLWLGAEVFRALEERARQAAPAVVDPAALRTEAASRPRVPLSTGPLYRPCPACKTPMTRINFERVSGILIDRCRDHGIWFDATELDAVLRFIKLGGERAAGEVEEQEARARLAQLKLKAEPKYPDDAGRGDFRMQSAESQFEVIPWLVKQLFKLSVLLLATLFATASSAAAEPASSSELVFFLQYIGTDYGTAVRDGKVIDTLEYAEMLNLSGKLFARYSALRPDDRVRSELGRLCALIQSAAPWDAVRALTQALAPQLIEALDVASVPSGAPDIQRGRVLYQTDCAACHGALGGGDGPSAPGMSPPPTSFRGSGVDLRSPYQVWNAVTLGVAETPMPTYGEARTSQDLWDVAFYVMTLRQGFDPKPPVEFVPLSLADVARASNEELLKRLRQTYPSATASDCDYYRVKFRTPEAHGLQASNAGDGSGLELAGTLERTFARVADNVSPSIVGVAAYKKSETASGDPAPKAGWRVGMAEQQLYPGYARATSGSGFFISDDGKLLTSAHLVTDAGELPKEWILDVELSGNRHVRAKALGIEPTLGVALLKIESEAPTRPAPIGNSELVRVGQWAIALGDPPGVAKVFVPGTISARPERTCYQADLLSTMLQTSIAIDPEGFGGPLVNVHGDVIGVMLPTGFTRAALQSGMVGPISALPIDLALNISRAIELKQSQRSPWIGVSVLEVSPASRRLPTTPQTGIYIDDVFEPSPASSAGIRVGDFLTRMNGQPIAGIPDFQRWLYTIGINAGVALEIVRDGKRSTFQVKIEERPQLASSK